MHVDYTSLVLLLMGQATSATWTSELDSALESVAGTPAIVGRNNSEWFIAGSRLEYLIHPATLDAPDIQKAKEACRDLDKEATLFYTEIDPQGIDLLTDNFSDWDEGLNVDFIIDHAGLLGQCTFIQYNGQEMTTLTKNCNGYIPRDTQILCVRRSQPTPRLARILERHLAATKQYQAAIDMQGIAVDSSDIPSYIGDMATTLSSQQKKTRTGIVDRSYGSC